MSGQPPEPGEYVGKHIAPGSYGPLVTPAHHGRRWEPDQPTPWEEQRPSSAPWQPGPQAPWPPAGAPGPQVEAKNGALSLFLSFIVPGLGTIVNGETTKGVLILGSYVLSVGLTITLAFVVVGLAFLPVMLGIWIFGMVDAYRGAERFNRAHGVRPTW